MTLGNMISKGVVLVVAGTALVGCSTSNYYDESQQGSGILVGGDSYRLLDSAKAYPPYQPVTVGSVTAERSEIRIFTAKSYRGNLGKLTTACAKQVGVVGPVQVDTGILKAEKYASLLPTANVSAYQQERTAQCVEASIKK